MRKSKPTKAVRHFFSSRRRFLPLFAPAYVEVIGIDEDGCYHKMQLDKDIQYTGQTIRAFVRITATQTKG